MISELNTDELVVYTVNRREVNDGDETALFKFYRDRQKLRNWLLALLHETDVVIFYIEEDETEQHLIATLKNFDINMFDLPVSTEEWRGKKYEAQHHVPLIRMPDETPFYIHLDTITRFICKNDKIDEISNKISMLF